MEEAYRWAAQRQPGPSDELTYPQESEHISIARILAAKGELNAAQNLLQRLLANAESGGRTSAVLEILLLQALTAQAAGFTDQAMTALTKALAVAEPCGFMRTFMDEGAPMARLLYEALTRDIAPAHVQSLLAAFPEAESEPPQHEPDSSMPTLIEPLSQRELEVLSLMAQGLTNADIAGRLFITLNTVKVHTRNINGKLDAHNRTQAVAKARKLGILPSS
jgi:LuxR family maltose regulon positive regulatory protein